MKGKGFILAVAAALALVVFASSASWGATTSFVSEATSVVDQIKTESASAKQSMEDFYKVFSRYAAKMVELENKIKRWQQQGYLCKEYEKCPEKWDLIYAAYGEYMREIERAFYEHRAEIQKAFADLHRAVYQGVDKLEDLKAEALTELPAKLEKIKAEQVQLEEERSRLEKECPQGSTSRACARKWRMFNRKARRMNRRLRRLLLLVKLNKMKMSIRNKLENILSGFSDWEDRTVEALATYSNLFAQYEDLSGASGIGQLISNIEEIRKLSNKMDELVQFSKGLEIHVQSLGSLIDKRMERVERDLGVKTVSRTEEIKYNTKILEQNQDLMRQIEQEAKGM